MPDSVGFEFRKKLLQSAIAEFLNNLAAVAGDKKQFLGVRQKDLGDEVTALFLKKTEDSDLVFKAFVRKMAVVAFVDTAVESDADGGPFGVFDFAHELGVGGR